MAKDLNDELVTLTMRFADFDRLKGACYLAGPQMNDIDRKIGQAMTEAHDRHNQEKR